jgi:GTP cyclohydrolase FolE2
MSISSLPARVRPIFAESFYDVPSQLPEVPIEVPTVAVRNQQVLLHIEDELLGGVLPVLCDVDARVSLRAEQRGIHMSRIERALQTSEPQSLTACAVGIAERIRDTQDQVSAEVRLRARVPLLTRTRVSGLSSPDTVEISAHAVVGSSPRVGLGLAATNMTACPCMQGYALTDLIGELGLDPEEGVRLLGRVPIATHSQRGNVRIGLESTGVDRLPGYRRVYEILAAHTALTQELLKRPDEYDLVKRVHLAPQFVEDVVRAVAGGMVRSLGADGFELAGLELDVLAESYESIHGHDISAQIAGPAADLAARIIP